MPAAPTDLGRALEPGSVPSGERAELEGGLAAAVGGGQGAGPAAPAGGAPAFPSMTNPLGMMLSGAVGQDDRPLTDGLSLGPGAGPAPEQSVMLTAEADKLRALAIHAETPLVRALARYRLQQMVLEERGA